MRLVLLWLAAIASAICVAQTGENVLGQVDIAGHKVPLVAPTSKGIYEKCKVVALPDGQKLAWMFGDNLSEPFRVNGGWSELSAWPSLKFDAAKPLHLKVIIATSAFVTEGRSTLRAQRTGMTKKELGEIDTALAQVKALIEVAGNGKCQVEYTIAFEDTPTIQIGDGKAFASIDGLLDGRSVSPTINSNPFSADDNSYWGPFAATVVIHSGAGAVTSILDHCPIGIVPFHSFKAEEPGWRLASAILHSIGSGESAVPQVSGRLRFAANHPASIARRVDSIGGQFVSVSRGAFEGGEGVLVDDSVVDWVASRLKNSRRLKFTDVQTWFLSDELKKGVAQALGLESPGQIVSPDYEAGLSDSGDLTVKPVEDAEGKRLHVDLPKANYSSGMIRVPVDVTKVTNSDKASLTFRVRTKSHEAWQVSLGDNRYVLVDSKSAPGRTATPCLIDFSGEWETVALPLTKTDLNSLIDRRNGRTEVHFQLADPGRAETAAATVEFADVQVVEDASHAIKPAAWTDPYASLQGKPELDSAETARLVADLNGPDVYKATQAAWALTRAKAPGAVPALLAQAQSANTALTYAACSALKHQDSPEADAALKVVLDAGPFELNRRLALLAIGTSLEKLTIRDLQSLLVSRSWAGRLAAIEAMGKMTIANKPIQIITMLQDEDPRVRAAVVKYADPNDEISAKRLLYGAVNDPSELVRMTSFERLLGSTVQSVKKEVFSSVRNESESIATAVLAAMGNNPKPEYRQPILQAIVDPRPMVRYMALSSLSGQAAPITLPEIQNLLSDEDPRVQMLLATLASIKKVTLPSEIVAKLKASPDYLVARAASQIGG